MKKLLSNFLIYMIAVTAIQVYSGVAIADEGKSLSGMESAVSTPYFIENRGQWQPEVLFGCSLPNLHISVTAQGIVYDYYNIEESPVVKRIVGQAIRMDIPIERTRIAKTGKVDYYVNYFKGNDQKKWASNVACYKLIKFDNVYENINLKLYLDGGYPRYDYEVMPGGNPADIAISLTGANSHYLKDRAIVVDTRFGPIVHGKILAYQTIEGSQMKVECNLVEYNGTYRFDIGSYNKNLPLIIDPLVYSSYIGGSTKDNITGISLAGNNGYIVTGWTESADFITTPGVYGIEYRGDRDAFVTKINFKEADFSIVFSTYIGADQLDEAKGVATDLDGNIYLAGITISPNFPLIGGGFQNYYGGGTDGFVTKLNPTGTQLMYSSYLGGNGDDTITGIKVGYDGNAYMVGWTDSKNFPVQGGAYSNKLKGMNDVFAAKVNKTGTALEFSTYIGGTGDDKAYALDVSQAGAVAIVGETTSGDFPMAPYRIDGWGNLVDRPYDYTANGGKDVFVINLTGNGGKLQSSTYFGGSADDIGTAIAFDTDGTIFFAGTTAKESGTPRFPVTASAYQAINNGGIDGFFAKLDIVRTGGGGWAGSSQPLLFATYFGGKNEERVTSMVMDRKTGAIYICGKTNSTNFPLKDADFSMIKGGFDSFITAFDNSGSSLVYSTFLGGKSDDFASEIKIDSVFSIVVAGTTAGNYPVSENALQKSSTATETGFITKIASGAIQLLAPTGNETYCTGSTVQLKWQLQNIDPSEKFKVQLGRKSTTNWTTIAENITGTAYNWMPQATIEPGNDYIIKISHRSGLSVVNTNAFSIGNPPKITNFVYESELCEGGTIRIVAAPQGKNLKYQWKHNEQNLTIGDSVLEIKNATPKDGGKYELVLKGDCSPDAVSPAANIFVKAKARIETQPQSITVNRNAPASFSIISSGESLAYQWQKDKQTLIGKDQPTLQIPSAQSSDEGMYRCLIVNTCGKDTSNEAKLVVDTDVPYQNILNSDDINISFMHTNDLLTIYITQNKDSYTEAIIVDNFGSIVDRFARTYYFAGVNELHLSTGNLPSGLYWLVVTSGNKKASAKIPIIR